MIFPHQFIILLLLCAALAAGQEKASTPKEFGKDTLADLEKRDFPRPSSYLGIDPVGLLQLRKKDDIRELREPVPAFLIHLGAKGPSGRPYGRLINMPRIGVPFGLWVEARPDFAADSSEIEHLIGQTQLTHLRLSGEFTNLDMEAVAELKSLTHLDILATKVTGIGLKQIAGLNNLVYLNLRGSRVPGSCLKHLGGLKNLTELCLDNEMISDADLANVAAFKNLTRLTIMNVNAYHPHLDFYMRSKVKNRVGSTGLKHLVALPKLTTLVVEVVLSDADIKCLADFKRVTSLSISLTGPLTDVGLQQLGMVNNLARLHLSSETRITAEGVGALKTALPNCAIRWDGQK